VRQDFWHFFPHRDLDLEKKEEGKKGKRKGIGGEKKRRKGRDFPYNIYIPEFHEGKDISSNMYVDESDARLNSYNMIIGRDLLHELGIDLLFNLGVMKWGNATVPMRDPSQLRSTEIDAFEDEIFSMHDPTTADAARMQEIMDVKYA
jgi:hypothetical protein